MKQIIVSNLHLKEVQKKCVIEVVLFLNCPSVVYIKNKNVWKTNRTCWFFCLCRAESQKESFMLSIGATLQITLYVSFVPTDTSGSKWGVREPCSHYMEDSRINYAFVSLLDQRHWSLMGQANPLSFQILSHFSVQIMHQQSSHVGI